MTASIKVADQPQEAVQREMMIFDDGSDFAWVAELECSLPGVTFRKLKTFEAIDTYLDDIETGRKPLPDVLAIDVHCSKQESFKILGVNEVLEQNRAGFQLYKLVFRNAFAGTIETLPTIFFTSWETNVNMLEAQSLIKEHGLHIRAGSRGQFKENLLGVCLELGWINDHEARRVTGPGQNFYVDLFTTLSAKLAFTSEERCTFLGILSRDETEIPALLHRTAMANDMIDDLLDVSVLLDELVPPDDKRTYLLEEYDDDARLADLLISGSKLDMIRLKRVLEKRVGGRIL